MLTLVLTCLTTLGSIHGSPLSTETRVSPHFLAGSAIGQVVAIDEASGLCTSRINANIIYSHNDKGDGPKIYALSSLNGELKTTIHIHGANNYDWEDIACGLCDDNGGRCIYIADTGDHGGDGARNIIYKIREPVLADNHRNITVDIESKIAFQWSPHQQDCETLMMDPQRNIYLISKVNGGRGKIGMINSTAWNNSSVKVNVDNLVTIPLSTNSNDPTGGDIAPNGRDILVQTKHQLYYWQKADGQSIKETLTKDPVAVPFHYNKQAGAVAWDANGRGYYTASEGVNINMYYYMRQ
ncbi:uncharacterized protein [Argopecten irradians]|uniref:uncharacterized protein n=1 Tax=Argopecten irradians TaxID=31199 RepID=UPI003717F513